MKNEKYRKKNAYIFFTTVIEVRVYFILKSILSIRNTITIKIILVEDTLVNKENN